MGLFQRTQPKWEPVATQWPDERIDVDDRAFADAIAEGRRSPEAEAHNN